MSKIESLYARVKEYEIISVMNHGTLNARDEVNRQPFVTLGLKPVGVTAVSGRTQPFLSINALTKTGEQRVGYVMDCLNKDTGKFDLSKLPEDFRRVRGIFGVWSAPVHYQTERGKDGEVTIRKYPTNSSDKGMPMLASSVTAFIWEDDLENLEPIIASQIPAEAKIEYEDVKDYKYQSSTAQMILQRVKTQHASEGEDEVLEGEPVEEYG